MKKKIIAIYLLITTLFLTGCNGSKELDDYYRSMETFTIHVNSIKSSMENINTTDNDAAIKLLRYLDELDLEFSTLSQLEVPEQFSSNEAMADEASSYMTNAVQLFHQYFDDPEANYSVYEAACENYSRAMKRIGIISTILQGNLPEGDGVIVTEDDNYDFMPVTQEYYDDEFNYDNNIDEFSDDYSQDSNSQDDFEEDFNFE